VSKLEEFADTFAFELRMDGVSPEVDAVTVLGALRRAGLTLVEAASEVVNEPDETFGVPA